MRFDQGDPTPWPEQPRRGHSIDGAPTSTVAFVGSFPDGPALLPTHITSPVAFAHEFGGSVADFPATIAVRDFFAEGGDSAIVIRANATAEAADSNALMRSLELLTPNLTRQPRAQLLCVPDLGRRSAPLPEHDYQALMVRVAAFCEANAMFFLAEPNTATDDLQAISAWARSNTDWRSSNSAVFVPRLRTPASRSAGTSSTACGVVAGVIARCDRTYGVWKAPAGVTATINGDPLVKLTEWDQAPLNRERVNVIREQSGSTVVWGSRARGVSPGDGGEWPYVSVRRTGLFLEHSIRAGLQWTLVETNGDALWADIRTRVEEFLDTLWRQGAFRGASAHEAFFVRCGDDTMSRVDLRRNRTVVQIGFAPLRPGEFSVLRITLDRR